MSRIKYIVLSLLLMFSIFAVAQKPGKIGRDKYRVSTGDTTKIVNPVGAGLSSSESQFLFNTSGKIIDSLYNEIQPNVTPSKAVRDVNNILKEIERDQAILKAGNTSLSYRLSTEYIAAKHKEKNARAYADSLLQEQGKLSEKDLALNYLKYGNKPSYFVNGMPVNSEIASLLLPGDVIERNIKTKTPNPNGEIWLVLTDKAMQRLKLPASNVNSEYELPVYNYNNIETESTWRTSQPVIRVEDEPSISAPTQQNVNTKNQPQENPITIVRTRTVNNKPVEVKRRD
jgi:hypothetical protein